MNKKPCVYQLKISLVNSKPPIWRRLLVRNQDTLEDLHHAIQQSMGWENYHLYNFEYQGTFFEPQDLIDSGFNFETHSDTSVPLAALNLKKQDKLYYTYDFGDNWKHEILVEKIQDVEQSVHYPHCIDGKRACPPEDSGGAWCYVTMLSIIANKEHTDYEETLEWLGDDFDPEAFDVGETNERLQTAAATVLK